MSALIDIVITFIAALVSAAFVHFGAHSEKPRQAPASPPPAEQTRQTYEPARFETISEEAVEPAPPEAEAPPAPPAPPVMVNVKVAPVDVDVRVDIEHAETQARIDAENMARNAAQQARAHVQSQRAHDREMRKWQNQERSRINAR